MQMQQNSMPAQGRKTLQPAALRQVCTEMTCCSPVDGNPETSGQPGPDQIIAHCLKLAAFHGDPDGRKPLLLLDDILKNWTGKRMEALFSVISEGSWGGMFLTDADSSRSQDILRNQQVLFDRVVTNNPD